MIFEPKFSINNAITAGLTKIERARGFLDAAKLSSKWIGKMQKRALLLEAHHTTHIEGTQLTLEQSEQILSDPETGHTDSDDARELLNYRNAFEFVSEYLESYAPITEGLVLEIHKRLVQGVRGNRAGPGMYRKVQNYVVNGHTQEVTDTPPGPFEVPELMTEFIAWLRDENEINPVLIAGIAQFQLVHIHPFLDGNGRTARLLSTLLLYQRGYDFKRLFTVSEYYNRDRRAYYDAIQSVRQSHMDLTDWLTYFVGGLAAQMSEVQTLGEGVIRQDLALGKARVAGVSDRGLRVLKLLLKRGRATVGECEEALDENRRGLQRDLKKLVAFGFVQEIGQNPTDPKKYYIPDNDKL